MDIPKKAKRVFKGVIFDVYHWRQKLFDGSYATFERLKRKDSAIIIPTVGNKIIIVEEEQPRKPSSKGMIGGMGEYGESPLETAKRELLEEVGYSSEDWELLKTYSPLSMINYSINLFVARNCRKVKEPHLDAGEKVRMLTVNFDEFMATISKSAQKKGAVALELYYIGLIKSKRNALKKKILNGSKPNPFKLN